MSKNNFFLFFCAVGLLLLSNPASTCLHPYRNPGTKTVSSNLKQAAQQALILHHDGVEDLFLKVDYSGNDIEKLGWIIPVPAAPDSYAVADNALFSDLVAWSNVKRHKVKKQAIPKGVGPKTRSKSQPKSPLKLLPNTVVGPFQIQPIQAQGASAVTALNQWMKSNGFDTFSAEQLSYYIDRQWTFLAVKISGKGEAKIDDKGSLPPLQVTFKTEHAVYPLKFSTHMGEFSSQVTLITAEQPKQDAFNGARARGFEVISHDSYQSGFLKKMDRLSAQNTSFQVDLAPASLQAPLKKRFKDTKGLFSSILFNKSVNKGQRKESKEHGLMSDSPVDWAEDLSVPGLAPGEKLMGKIVPDQAEAIDAKTAKSSEEISEKTNGNMVPKEGESTKSIQESESSVSGCGCSAMDTKSGGWLFLFFITGVAFGRRKND